MADKQKYCECSIGQECKCGLPKKEASKQAATQPSDKYLPKEDKGNVKDGDINLPVNPYEEGDKGDKEYTKDRPHGKYQEAAGGKKNAEVPADIEFWSQKIALNEGREPTSFEGKEFWALALDRLHSQLAENIATMATTDVKFYSKPCSWKIGKDGMRVVSFNYIQESNHSFSTKTTFGGEQRDFVAKATLDKQVVLSKHMDDRSAILACQLYNKYLNIK